MHRIETIGQLNGYREDVCNVHASQRNELIKRYAGYILLDEDRHVAMLDERDGTNDRRARNATRNGVLQAEPAETQWRYSKLLHGFENDRTSARLFDSMIQFVNGALVQYAHDAVSVNGDHLAVCFAKKRSPSFLESHVTKTATKSSKTSPSNHVGMPRKGCHCQK